LNRNARKPSIKRPLLSAGTRAVRGEQSYGEDIVTSITTRAKCPLSSASSWGATSPPRGLAGRGTSPVPLEDGTSADPNHRIEHSRRSFTNDGRYSSRTEFWTEGCVPLTRKPNEGMTGVWTSRIKPAKRGIQMHHFVTTFTGSLTLSEVASRPNVQTDINFTYEEIS
jgi:hypothetical protein